jgi:hypothetical protein
MNAVPCQPLNMVRNKATGGCRKRLKGTKMQLANINHAMMEMLRGRVVVGEAAIGGVEGDARPSGVARAGGGGVAE